MNNGTSDTDTKTPRDAFAGGGFGVREPKRRRLERWTTESTIDARTYDVRGGLAITGRPVSYTDALGARTKSHFRAFPTIYYGTVSVVWVCVTD